MTEPKLKLTPWFAGTVKPVRHGAYRRRWPAEKAAFGYCRYDGLYWYWPAPTTEEAVKETGISSYQDGPEWRGLAEKP